MVANTVSLFRLARRARIVEDDASFMHAGNEEFYLFYAWRKF